jgi:vitamin B12/bleomycin/antimicrobial peptide transport system ATP-binding/permease protein
MDDRTTPPPTSGIGFDGPTDKAARQRILLFWHTAKGFWSKSAGWRPWILSGAILLIVLVELYIKIRINTWNRSLFDALEKKDAAEVLIQSFVYIGLLVVSVIAALTNVYSRMTIERHWREWLTNHLMERWLAQGRYYHLNLIEGDHKNPEYRLSEDIRLATDAPIDFVCGVLAAFLSAVTFISVLWVVGGALDINIGGRSFHIPGFLVIAVIIYALLGTGSMLLIGRNFSRLSAINHQREAEFRYALTRVRENGESIALLGGEKEERAELDRNLRNVLTSWSLIIWQHVRTTFVSQTSHYVAPVLPILICAPKYLAGDMSLGQVMQAASAFVIVQHAFGWVVDNYPRFANWSANATRVASLISSLDALELAEKSGGIQVIAQGGHETKALRLRGLSVNLDDGTGVVHEAEVEIAPGERVIIVGESGTGKSTLVRAIAGLWPWGEGQIVMQSMSKLLMLPQKGYVPLGTLRRAATYPMAPEAAGDETIREALSDVGLGHLLDRLDEEAPWEQTLSGGEKQRVAFARLLIHQPDLIVLDEATSALDTESQGRLMNLLNEKMPNATVISVGHRPELEAYHGRKLVLEHRPGGARLIRDEYLTIAPGPRARLFQRFMKWQHGLRGGAE